MESALSAGAGEPGLKLIETLGWTGSDFPRLALHMARLTVSAVRLGWACDSAEAEAALRAAVPPGPARMRLTLDRLGALEVKATPLPLPPPQKVEGPQALTDTTYDGPARNPSPLPGEEGRKGAAPIPSIAPGPGQPPRPWRLGLAPIRLLSTDPWLTLKTTRRPAYDAARASLPPGLDELVFQNERGEVCDGTITTLFFDRGQGLRTPPLASGLLPGVLRAELARPEEVLLATDLPHVRLWVGNSLRGLIPALWQP